MSLFDRGDDAFKCAIHGATLMLAMEMGAYNAIVYRKRGTGWHLFSSLFYGGLCILEGVQMYRHCADRDKALIINFPSPEKDSMEFLKHVSVSV